MRGVGVPQPPAGPGVAPVPTPDCETPAYLCPSLDSDPSEKGLDLETSACHPLRSGVHNLPIGARRVKTLLPFAPPSSQKTPELRSFGTIALLLSTR